MNDPAGGDEKEIQREIDMPIANITKQKGAVRTEERAMEIFTEYTSRIEVVSRMHFLREHRIPRSLPSEQNRQRLSQAIYGEVCNRLRDIAEMTWEFQHDYANPVAFAYEVRDRITALIDELS